MRSISLLSTCALALTFTVAPSSAHAQGIAGSYDQLRGLVWPGDEVIVVDAKGRESTGRIADLSPSSLVLTVSLAAPASPAAAQEPEGAQRPGDVGPASTPGSSSPAFDRRVQVGVGVGGDLVWGGGGVDNSLLITIPATDRYAVEVFGGMFHGKDYWHTKTVYGVQVKRTIDRGREAGVVPFISYGAMGSVNYSEETTCTAGKCVKFRPRHVTPPIAFLTGVGAEFTVKPRVIVRLEVQGAVVLVLPVSLRVAATVKIPIGRAKSAGRTAASR
jgi:hypothetical protein